MAQKINFGDGEINIPQFDPSKMGRFLFIPFIAILLVRSFYTVGANENAVVTRLGKYSTTTMPGLHFKIPLVDTVEKVKVDYQYKLEFVVLLIGVAWFGLSWLMFDCFSMVLLD